MAVWSNTSLSEISENFGRLDAEYFRPEYLTNDHLLEKLPLTSLRSVASKIDVGHVGSMVKHYTDDGVLLLQTQNVKEFFLDLNHTINITPSFHEKLNKSKIQYGDILIARSGSFGSAAVYLEDGEINSADIIIVNAPEGNGIDPLFLVAFMNSRFGSTQLVRFASGGVQGHVNLKILEYFKIPRISDTNQREIAELVRLAYSERKTSEAAYTQAQQLLESELGLDKLRFDKPVGYTARFSVVGLADSVNANRIDAQCFSPESVFYEDWLLKHANCDRLGLLLASTAKGRQQTEAETGTTDYCSIKHVTGREMVGASKTYPSAGTPTAKKDDLLLAITGATIGKIGIINRYENLVFSGDMLRLRPNGSVSPHYLLLTLDHYLGQVQFNRWITGSTNGHLAPRDVGRILVPRLAPATEEQIVALVAESLEKRQESEHLLDQAKSRVEHLIEEAVQL